MSNIAAPQQCSPHSSPSSHHQRVRGREEAPPLRFAIAQARSLPASGMRLIIRITRSIVQTFARNCGQGRGACNSMQLLIESIMVVLHVDLHLSVYLLTTL